MCCVSSLRWGVDKLCLLFLATGKQQPCYKTIYRICSIRRRGYYLFHRAILCSFYSRAATNPERRLFNSVFSIKSFVFVRALRKVSFIRLTKNCDVVTWFWNKHSSLISRHFATYTAPPIRSSFSSNGFTWWSPSMPENFSGQRAFLYLSRILLPFETQGCSRAHMLLEY